MDKTMPRKAQERLIYFADISSKITADPARYGLNESGAAKLASHLAAAQAAVRERTAIENRRKAKVSAMRTAVEACTGVVRSLLNTARSRPGVSDTRLAELRVIRPKAGSPVRPPEAKPKVAIGRLSPGRVELLITPAGPGASRGRPKGTMGAWVVMCDASKPAGRDGRGTAHRAMATKPCQWFDTGKLKFSRIRVYAQWMSKRSEPSPYSDPVEFNAQT